MLLAGHAEASAFAIEADPAIDGGAADGGAGKRTNCHVLHDDTFDSLDDHRAERGEFVRQLLQQAGIQPSYGPQDGPYQWERPAPTDPDIPPRPLLLLQAVAERQRWKAEYTAAQLLTAGKSPHLTVSAIEEAA